MKRSSALAPLSRDHHLALVVARGLANAEPAEAAQAASRFVEFLAQHELGHFALEETVLLPAMSDTPRSQALAERMLEDHEYLRCAARRLGDPEQTVTTHHLHEVGQRLRSHVQMEERELFPYVEQTLGPDALAELGARLGESHRD